MMDMFSAYSVGSFEMRLLTFNVQVSPSEHDEIDESCLSCFTAHSHDWLQIEHGFHTCSSFESDQVKVSCFFFFLFSCPFLAYIHFEAIVRGPCRVRDLPCLL